MLEASDLACERGGVELFAGVGFSLGAGGLLQVRGANGSGKTSLLRMLAGLSRPWSGTVRWSGSDIRTLGEDYARELLFIGHADALKEELSGAENLRLARAVAGRPATDEECAQALARVGLADRAGLPVRFLSRGQRRRAALSRLCLSADTPLWILDEPFAALDARALEATAALVEEHLERGGAAVLTTHQEVRIAARASNAIALGG